MLGGRSGSFPLKELPSRRSTLSSSAGLKEGISPDSPLPFCAARGMISAGRRDLSLPV